MLTRLEIKNLAVIEHAVFCPLEGLNVISGETGAGKSLLIDAIELIFGQKASKDLIRYDSASAYVEAVFDLDEKTSARIKPLLDDYGIPLEDSMVIISRSFKEEGKSVARINGVSVVLSQLRKVSSELIDIHGQNDNSRLFDPSVHIELLDSYGGKKIKSLLDSYRNKLSEYKDITVEYSEVSKLVSTSSSEVDYLKFALKEITDASLHPHEDEELAVRKKELSALARDHSLISEANDLINGSDVSGLTASGRLEQAVRIVRKLASKDDSYTDLLGRLESLSLDMEAFASDFAAKTSNGVYNEEEERKVTDRLGRIYELESKYGSSVEEVLKFADDAGKKLDEIEIAGARATELKKKMNEVKDDLLNAATKLSDERKNLAQGMSEAITEQLKDLEMPSSSFFVKFDTRSKEKYFNINGIDEVSFMFTANPGQPAMDLASTASGGEASRIMLAIKNVLSAADTIPTLIFDEIDTGVSGKASLSIAKKLRSISKAHQVLCVSHTAQLAAASDMNFLIEKNTDGNNTFTKITPLDEEGRVVEVSRLLSGNDNDESLKLASRMIGELRT